MGVLETVVVAIWLMLPAYLPNNVAVLAGGGPPIDGGRRWRGQRVLGDGKTWRGTGAGIAAGVLLALALNLLNPSVPGGVDLPEFPVLAVLALPTGAMLGDMVASFLKRRTGRERGAPFPGVDQLDFVIGALGLCLLAAPTWFLETFTLGVLVVIFVVTPVLHVTTNALGYALGVKDEPW